MTLAEELWKELIEYRAQTSSWDLNQPVDKSVIEEVIDEVHRRCPSKQNRVPYEIHVLDWSNTELRNDFYEFAVDRDSPIHRYNAQTLAQYLFVFVGRLPADFSRDFSPLKGKLDDRMSHLEIGLACHMIIHALRVRGLCSGFCRCFDYNGEYAEKVRVGLGLDTVDHIYLSLGVGIPSSDPYQTLNLHTNQFVDAWKQNGEKWYKEPKPDPSEYIIYHTS